MLPIFVSGYKRIIHSTLGRFHKIAYTYIIQGDNCIQEMCLVQPDY
jgi:hypothetical protein